MQTITIRKPDDWHCHLRDTDMLSAVIPFTVARFGRAIIMPNLSPKPVTTTDAVCAYRERIQRVVDPSPFTPLMTYYLTDTSSPDEIAQGFKNKDAYAAKLYPAGATTNSENGVTEIMNVYPVFEAMQNARMPLLLHGEAVQNKKGETVDPYDREKVFLDETLTPLLKDFPELKVVLEHATTKEAVQYVRNEKSKRLGATITVHHLMLSKEDWVEEHVRPYVYCLPVVKTMEDRNALREAATSGEPYFFLGTDSAPHAVSKKEQTTGYPGGIFTAPAALELYAQVFDEMGKLENFEAFASLNGPRFYGLLPNTDTVTLEKNPWTIDTLTSVSNGDSIRPFGYHEDPKKRLIINWRLAASPRGTRNTM